MRKDILILALILFAVLSYSAIIFETDFITAHDETLINGTLVIGDYTGTWAMDDANTEEFSEIQDPNIWCTFSNLYDYNTTILKENITNISVAIDIDNYDGSGDYDLSLFNYTLGSYKSIMTVPLSTVPAGTWNIIFCNSTSSCSDFINQTDGVNGYLKLNVSCNYDGTIGGGSCASSLIIDWLVFNATYQVLDSTPPSIMIIHPVDETPPHHMNNATNNFRILTADVGSGVDSVWYNITNTSDGSMLFKSGSCSGGTYEWYWHELGNSTDGNYTYTVCANDTGGNTNCSFADFIIDNTNPIIDSYHVSEKNSTNHFSGIANISFNVSASDSNLFGFDFNLTTKGGTQILYFNETNLTSATYWFNYTIDISGYPSQWLYVKVGADDDHTHGPIGNLNANLGNSLINVNSKIATAKDVGTVNFKKSNNQVILKRTVGEMQKNNFVPLVQGINTTIELVNNEAFETTYKVNITRQGFIFAVRLEADDIISRDFTSGIRGHFVFDDYYDDYDDVTDDNGNPLNVSISQFNKTTWDVTIWSTNWSPSSSVVVGQDPGNAWEIVRIHSLGGLNRVEETYRFETYTCDPVDGDWAIPQGQNLTCVNKDITVQGYTSNAGRLDIDNCTIWQNASFGIRNNATGWLNITAPDGDYTHLKSFTTSRYGFNNLGNLTINNANITRTTGIDLNHAGNVTNSIISDSTVGIILGSSNITIRGVEISNTSSHGIWQDTKSDSTKISDVFVHNLKGAGLQLYDASQWSTGISLQNITMMHGGGYGITVRYSLYFTLSNVTVFNTTLGSMYIRDTSYGVFRNIVTNNSGEYGLDEGLSDHLTITDWSANNHVYSGIKIGSWSQLSQFTATNIQSHNNGATGTIDQKSGISIIGGGTATTYSMVCYSCSVSGNYGASGYNDVYVTNNGARSGTMLFVNTSFNDSKVTANAQTDFLDVAWYVKFNATFSNSSAAIGADVNVTNLNGAAVYGGTIDSDGETDWQQITARRISTTITGYTPHTAEANLTIQQNLFSGSNATNVTERRNHIVYITLNDLTNPAIENATRYGSGAKSGGAAFTADVLEPYHPVVIFQSDYQGSMKNFTATHYEGNEWFYNATGLNVGDWEWRFCAEDYDGNSYCEPSYHAWDVQPDSTGGKGGPSRPSPLAMLFPSHESNCTDGIDNDGDDKIDCNDPDCCGKEVCYGSGTCERYEPESEIHLNKLLLFVIICILLLLAYVGFVA